MKHLALYLRAPLQSWGASSKFGDRGTLDAPTRSGLTGLLAAACGVDKNDEARDHDWLTRAALLSFEVVGFKRGDRMTDYHTVGGGRRFVAKHPSWQNLMIPVSADGKDHRTNVTHRDYLSDSVFGAVLSGDDALVAEMAAALENPVWGVWLGRKSCIPTEPVLAGVFESAEAAHAALADRWRRSAERAGKNVGETTTAFSVVEALPGEADETVLDVPVSFAKRVFHARGIRRDVAVAKENG